MLKCNYCGRLFKRSYESCPGCGAAQFKNAENSNNIVISNPPEGGYNNLSGGIIEKVVFVVSLFFIVIGISVMFESVGVAIICFVSLMFDGSELALMLPVLIFSTLMTMGIGLVFLKVGGFLRRRIKHAKYKREILRTSGILIKNMTYDIVDTGNIINGDRVYAIKVVYIDPNGVEIPLVSKKEYKGHVLDNDGGVDLLIDPDDYTNYYIDFEIY